MLIVYVAEAHAADVWPINSTRCRGPGNSVRQPRSLDERRSTARQASLALGLEALPMLLDSMDDAFLSAFAAWPVRLFGITASGDTVERIAKPHDAAFELAPMLAWLDGACATSTQGGAEEGTEGE